ARLKGLTRRLEEELGQFERRTFVDTGRLVDRAAAVRAGLGWYGKNTNVLNSRLGSWLFLAELVTTLELEPDEPTRRNCGQCRACIDACPTGAITAPYVVDNNRCISFLTIELREPIPRELRPLMGGYIFGCDACQDVCPVNTRAEPVFHADLTADGRTPTIAGLADLLHLDEAAFRERFRGTPLMRPKRRGLLRNVAVALGNSGDRSAIPVLAEALSDPEPLVRGHAAWALGRLGGRDAKAALARAAQAEREPYVLEEIRLANPTE
ncbi:MAG: tRNA epoxyqueuosine(34) reductase QueG, partial [Chloroflexota bacterium]|nr:tRNA epoxyqueuosine(34) reductase QueG [Chloroflexota bacterium]